MLHKFYKKHSNRNDNNNLDVSTSTLRSMSFKEESAPKVLNSAKF